MSNTREGSVLLGVVATLACLLAGNPAQATPVTFDVTMRAQQGQSQTWDVAGFFTLDAGAVTNFQLSAQGPTSSQWTTANAHVSQFSAPGVFYLYFYIGFPSNAVLLSFSGDAATFSGGNILPGAKASPYVFFSSCTGSGLIGGPGAMANPNCGQGSGGGYFFALGTSGVATVHSAPVPEPGTMILLLTGGLTAGVIRRLRRR